MITLKTILPWCSGDSRGAVRRRLAAGAFYCLFVLGVARLSAGEPVGNRPVPNGAAIVDPGTWNGRAVFAPRPEPSSPADTRPPDRPRSPEPLPWTSANPLHPAGNARKSAPAPGTRRPLSATTPGSVEILDLGLETDLSPEALPDDEEAAEHEETDDRTLETRSPAPHGPVKLRLPDGTLFTVRPGALVQLQGRKYTVVGRLPGGRLVLRERGTGKLRKLKAKTTLQGEVFIAKPTERAASPSSYNPSLPGLPPRLGRDLPE
ncbi:MAG: hypothetical protein GXP31_02025 [Kiritimatiellaeota bacterium]|nr:hypothetical protein [Kiritimatiellota bacterium]